MLSVAPVSVLVMGLIGMLVIAFSVMRMAVEERRYRGHVAVHRAPSQSPRTPQPAHRA